MKKLNLTFLSVILATCVSYSQHFDIRAYGGVNILQLTSDKSESLINGILHEHRISGRPGLQVGAALTFGSRFFVQPGFQYSMLSTQIVNENSVTSEKLLDQTTIGAVSVPLKVGFRLIDPETEKLINLRVFGGFDGSHVMSVKHSTKSNAIDDIDATDYSNLIVNADFGLGLDVFIFYIDMGYQLGLTPVFKSGDSSKANAFYTNLGLKFSFGK